ncbi:BMC domain-containing protein [Cohnella mopanensis]|uniref:BMC domain-containing protein n=1 Tax=Cohnella mopanensis TaxID=2911966 RepID=UPI0034E1C7EE
MIETWGVPALIAAADAAAKTADVEVTAYEKADAGIVTIYLLGDVAAVQTAVDAGGEAAKKVGKLLGTHVIPRPDDSVFEMVWGCFLSGRDSGEGIGDSEDIGENEGEAGYPQEGDGQDNGNGAGNGGDSS